ncbi:MAG: hypothetical protein WBO45_20815, partial [Planctomycetota bacterium]
TTGGPAGPSAPAPGQAKGGSAGPTTGRGVTLAEDYDTWDYWWEHNKCLYLPSRAGDARIAVTGSDDFYLGGTRRSEASDEVRPTRDESAREVLPLLHRELASTTSGDVATACLVAMAKIGVDHREFRLADVFRSRLSAADQEVRETAALAFGIAALADDRSLALLTELALDRDAGRTAVGGRVDERTRAFAAYGLGLAAHHCGAAEVQERVFAVLARLLADDGRSGRDVRVAAISAIGLLAVQRRTHAARRLQAEATALLGAWFARDLGGGDELVQAHCPTAIARLVGRDLVLGARHQERFCSLLNPGPQATRGSSAIAQSCALALGLMAAPDDGDGSAGADCGEALRTACRSHPDRLTRHFALLGLARAGGSANRAALLKEFDGANSQRRPWCALALGVLSYHARADVAAAGPDGLVGDTLLAAWHAAKEPGLVGALAVALGLAGVTEAGELLAARLRSDFAKEKMAGYLCIGLALLQRRGAAADIRGMLGEAERRPLLLVQAAVALGRLGDRATGTELCSAFTAGEASLVRSAALAAAIGHIGDRGLLLPLSGMLGDDRLGALRRAFAAVALGGVCDWRPLPWNAPLRGGVNYRAAVPTLTDQLAGVLDIL